MIRRYFVNDGIETFGFLMIIAICVLGVCLTYGTDYLY